jgi:aromatic-L-amino-acid decarboxylase
VSARRRPSLEMTPDEFRRAGHRLVDRIAEHLAALPDGPVKPDESSEAVRRALGADSALPSEGADAAVVLDEVSDLLVRHSLFNGHPRFFGYITSSPAPIGALGDLLAAAINQNVGSWTLAPMATEIEAQTVRWIAELIGFSAASDDSAGGILVSGGNMANFVCVLAARTARLGPDVRTGGLAAMPAIGIYASAETHTWIHKAADVFGVGTDNIRWIPVDGHQRMRIDALRRAIDDDRRRGVRPLIVVGTAGSVSTGAVDPLSDIAAVCREQDLWFHVDGAYGALAAGVPGAPPDLRGLAEADSVAVDPHKWLYAPLEAGCAVVRRAGDLRNAFSYHPPYYQFRDAELNYVDYGLQNSRGFRALKVWLGLRQLGRDGCLASIAEDIRLSQRMRDLLQQRPRFEVFTQSLSITTFRYVPDRLRGRQDAAANEELNGLNRRILSAVEKGGQAFFSNAVVDGRFALRACIVNFRTTDADVERVPDIVESAAAACGAG